MATQSILTISGLTKNFGSFTALKRVDLSVRPGEVVFIIGPSGSGKSTLLRCINFLEVPDGGAIAFDGLELCRETAKGFERCPPAMLRQARQRMPMVFQHFNLLKHRTILENVTEGPTIVQRRPRGEAAAEAQAILEKLGLSEKLDFYPGQLSGGQQQRVGIARALAMKPRMILFDEPTSALDPELVSEVLESIRQLANDGMTMIIVTHEMAFARKLADTVYFMADGRVEEFGPPQEIFDAPKGARLRSFISSMVR